MWNNKSMFLFSLKSIINFLKEYSHKPLQNNCKCKWLENVAFLVVELQGVPNGLPTELFSAIIRWPSPLFLTFEIKQYGGDRSVYVSLEKFWMETQPNFLCIISWLQNSHTDCFLCCCCFFLFPKFSPTK